MYTHYTRHDLLRVVNYFVYTTWYMLYTMYLVHTATLLDYVVLYTLLLQHPGVLARLLSGDSFAEQALAMIEHVVAKGRQRSPVTPEHSSNYNGQAPMP